jgi:hypothetical protein
MAIRVRNLNKRQALSSNTQAWLRGDESCGFFKFKPVAELEALFEEHGDHDAMFYRGGMLRPITVEKLEAFEDSWLDSGESDE